MKRLIDRALLGGAVLLQLLVLYLPRAPGGPEGIPHLDKVVHAAVFALVAWTARRVGISAGLVVVLLGSHAVVSELIQGYVLPDRSGDPFDAVADFAGVIVGCLVPVRSPSRRRPSEEDVRT